MRQVGETLVCVVSLNRFCVIEQVVVLDNGCMCCSVRGDLLGAFRSVSAKVKEGNPIDSVLIETTGLANPVPIVSILGGYVSSYSLIYKCNIRVLRQTSLMILPKLV